MSRSFINVGMYEALLVAKFIFMLSLVLKSSQCMLKYKNNVFRRVRPMKPMLKCAAYIEKFTFYHINFMQITVSFWVNFSSFLCEFESIFVQISVFFSTYFSLFALKFRCHHQVNFILFSCEFQLIFAQISVYFRVNFSIIVAQISVYFHRSFGLFLCKFQYHHCV